MMRDIDSMIDEALRDEEREVLRRIGEQPGFFRQAFGVFSGPSGWVNVILMIVQAVMFIVGVWAAWHFFTADRVEEQLRWGLPAAVLLILAAIVKMALLPRMETNLIIRELKRLELQLALKRD